MTKLALIDFTCPNCETDFTSRIALSWTHAGMTTELRRVALNTDPLPFAVHCCRACGFAGYRNWFEDEVDKSVAEKIEQHIKPLLGDDELTADTKWEIAAMIAEWRNMDPLEIAQMYKHVAWCTVDTERQSFYRRKAAGWFERAIETDFPNRPTILYLIGELYRRCGEKNIADTWFDAAIREARGKDAKQLRELALQQKTDPRKIIE